MKRHFALLASAILAVGAAGCSDKTEPEQEKVGQGYEHYDTAGDIRDTLAASDWKCSDWKDVNEDGMCLLPGRPGWHSVHMTEKPDIQAIVEFRNNPDIDAVIVGDNWMFSCGDEKYLSTEDCALVANILHGTIQRR